MQRRLRRFFCAMKEHGTMSYAKIATVGGFCDVNHIIVKATAPDNLPIPERHIQELLKIFSISPASFHVFSLSFTRRFGRTHCWRVALKCLLLLHRLLKSLPEYSPFRTELLWARASGLLSLYPCHFRDDSSSNPEAYTAFIRSYAQLLDEALDCVPLDYKETIEEQLGVPTDTFQDRIKEVGRMLEMLPQFQSLIDRVIECRPRGVAARSFIIQVAMKHIIRDSFFCYATFRRKVILLMDNLIQMPYRNCIVAFGIYKKAALQADQLCEFYEWCKGKGFCGSYEYPIIDRIPELQVRALESFLNGMWQLTETSSTATSPSSWVESKWSGTDDGVENKQIVGIEFVNDSRRWEKFEENNTSLENLRENEEMAPLIQLEDEEENNWEALLEASVNLSRITQSNNFMCTDSGNEIGYIGDSRDPHWQDKWQMEVYNVNAVINPFW